jgi:transcriptional regulator with XRE-family HTH domain
MKECSDKKIEIIFANRLRQRRIDLHFTQTEMARMLGIERSSYTYYEMGKTQPNLKTLKKLKKILDVSLDYLIGD